MSGTRTGVALLIGLVLAAICWPAYADAYAGIRLTYSAQKPNVLGDRVGPTYIVRDRLLAAGVYVGYTTNTWSLEVGAGPLGSRSSHNVGRGFDIQQIIETKHVYGAVLHHWQFGRFSPHVLLGLSRVSMKNHEFGFNETGAAVQLNYSHTSAPMLGGGGTYRFAKVDLRAEAFRIANVARSIWTNSSDVTAVSVGVQYRF
jgi:hypothetical protein